MEKERKKPGLKPGQTNNLAGRPKGSKNIVSLELKTKITSILEGNTNVLEKALRDDKTPIYLRGKLYIEASKLVVPRPVSDEEQEGMSKLYGGLSHLFGKSDE